MPGVHEEHEQEHSAAPLDEDDRVWLRRLAERYGEQRAAKIARLSRNTFARGLAGLNLYRVSRECVRAARASHASR